MNIEALKQQAMRVVAQHLGEPMLYHYRGGDTQSVCGIFSIVNVEVDLGGVVPVNSRAASCSFERDPMQRRPMEGDQVTRRDVTYEVKRVADNEDSSFRCWLFAVDQRHAHSVRSRT